MPLVIFDPHPQLFLRLWVRGLRNTAVAARTTVNNREVQCLTKANDFISSRERLSAATTKLNRAQRRLRNRVKGVPLTEDYDAPSPLVSSTPEISDAEAFILKKAYRLAASIAHPDKGGSVEAFQGLRQAFLARDLRAVQEFYLVHQKSLLEQIAYWKDELLRPAIQWQKFQQTPAYQISSQLARGCDLAVLEASVLAFLNDQITRLQLQELNFMVQQEIPTDDEA